MAHTVKLSLKPRNLVAKDLRTPKYRQRVELSEKVYSRPKNKQNYQKEIHVFAS
jgi:hypothetical protein